MGEMQQIFGTISTDVDFPDSSSALQPAQNIQFPSRSMSRTVIAA